MQECKRKEREESRFTMKVTFNRNTGWKAGKHRVTYNIDRQRLKETEGTKYTEESNIMR